MKKFLKLYIDGDKVEIAFAGGLKDMVSFFSKGISAILSKLPDDDREDFVKGLVVESFLALKFGSKDTDEPEEKEDSSPLHIKELFDFMEENKFAEDFFDGSPLTFYLYKCVEGKDEFLGLYHNSEDDIKKYECFIIDNDFGPNADMFMYNPRGLKIYVKEA